MMEIRHSRIHTARNRTVPAGVDEPLIPGGKRNISVEITAGGIRLLAQLSPGGKPGFFLRRLPEVCAGCLKKDFFFAAVRHEWKPARLYYVDTDAERIPGRQTAETA